MRKITIFLLLLFLAAYLWAANEIRFAYDSSDSPTLYTIIGRTTDANVWDACNTAWAFWVNANEPNYANDMSLVRKDFYDVQFPTDITTAGIYPVTIYRQADTEPNMMDDLIIGKGEIVWDGSAEITDYTAYTERQAIPEDVNTLIISAHGSGSYVADINDADIAKLNDIWLQIADANDTTTMAGRLADIWLTSSGGFP